MLALNLNQEKNSEWLQARLGEVDWDIKRELVSILETQNGLWRDLLAVLPKWLRSRIPIHQLESIHCPARALMQKLEQWSFNVAQLIVCFEALKLDSALMIIKPDVDLEIQEDLEDSEEVDVGEPLRLACRATGFPTPYYQWFKDDVELLQHQSPILRLDSASLDDSGTYYCKVYKLDRLTNDEQHSPLYSRICTVSVVEPPLPLTSTTSAGRGPEIELQPRSVENLPPGCTITLECRGIGDDPISYQWFKDEKLLHGETESELHLRHLLPDETTGNSSWKFMCLVTNPYGKIVSSTVTVALSRSVKDVLFTAKDKVALLIANERYNYMDSFTLPSADVATLSEILHGLGFRVMSYLDLTLSEMCNAVNHFCSELGEGIYAFFYFAGHGFEDQGQSYMQPVDAGSSYAYEENLCVDMVATQMQNRNPAMSFFLLDMCRERPDYEANPNVERRPPRSYQQQKYKNTVFGYATSFLGEAVEVEGSPNGLFVQYLKTHLAERKSICEILWSVKQDMSRDKLAKKEGQDPFVCYNLSEARSLRDPILCEQINKRAYELKWQEVYKCPEKQDFKLGAFRFVVTFKPHKDAFCNAIDMEVHYKQVHSSSRMGTPALCFSPRSIKVDKLPARDADCVKFILRGLQNLNRDSFSYTVVLKASDSGDVFSKTHSFTLPGLAKLSLTRNMLSDSQLYP